MFGGGSRDSSFTVPTTPGGRRENDNPEGRKEGVLVEEDCGCYRILGVYLVCLWLLTEETLDSTGIQSSTCVFEHTLNL